MLGIAPDSRTDRAAHYVAKALQDDGVKIVPVPVYYFDIQVSYLSYAVLSLAWHSNITQATEAPRVPHLERLTYTCSGSSTQDACKHANEQV